MKLVFATHNQNKIKEIKELLPSSFELLGLTEIDCTEEIEENGETLEENAKIKADYVKNTYGFDCFSDDSGLEVEALQGAPGVYSARYAGEHKNNEDNITKLLYELRDIHEPKAQFRTVIAIHFQGEELFFEGVVEGTITKEKRGEGGFGYDSVFVPKGYAKTFAELPPTVKKEISHRSKAFRLLLEKLA